MPTERSGTRSKKPPDVVVVNCHPVKNATADNLLPAGGGTFLNEVDGNLTYTEQRTTPPEQFPELSGTRHHPFGSFSILIYFR
jgi:hypothetical protein